MKPKEIIARRCARELHSGEIVNLGLGTPTLVANYLEPQAGIVLHTENGAFGFGGRPGYYDADSDLTNAGCEPITMRPGAALMELTTSLGAMRRGFIDVSILGALEVDAQGNLANWATKRQGRWWPGIGGAMDLCYGTPKVIAALTHVDKRGGPKVKALCTLPLTGSRCVKVIVTDLAVFDVRADGGLLLREVRDDIGPSGLRNSTEADFDVSPHLLLTPSQVMR
jgi:3-oxoacid CoA-transferase B subunit